MISKNEITELIEKAEEGPTLDYKEDLPLAENGDKAHFVKDIISLANSGETAHIIIGVEDGTGKPVGLKTSHNTEQLNQILKDKCDPPISIEYAEKTILGYHIGTIEIKCENPPYIVSVPDKYGGRLSANPNKFFHIQRGTVYVRNYNINQGAKRAELDKMYKLPYITLQSELQLSHKVSAKQIDDTTEVKIKFILINFGNVLATQPYIYITFRNIKEIVKCDPGWINISHLNNNIPTIRFSGTIPVCPTINSVVDGVTVRVSTDTSQIETDITLGATNMRFKEGKYNITLKGNNS